MRSIPESDWKKLRGIRDAALQRQCQKILDEVMALIQESKEKLSSHETYLKLYQKVKHDDKLIARDFDDWSRSNAIFHLLHYVNAGVLTREEFESFTEELQQDLSRHQEPRFFDPEEKLR